MNPTTSNQNAPLGIDEIRRMMIRYDGTVENLIVKCDSRRKQHQLLNLWNDPWEFERFLQQAAGIACAFTE